MAAVAIHPPNAFNTRHHLAQGGQHPSSSSTSAPSAASMNSTAHNHHNSHPHHPHLSSASAAAQQQQQASSSSSSGSSSAAPSTGLVAAGPSSASSAGPSSSNSNSSATPLRRAYNIRKGSSSNSAGASNPPAPTGSSSASSAAVHHHDTYYGHEEAAKICARFVAFTFGCPEILPPPPQQQSSSSGTPAPTPSAPNVPGTLGHFIAYALHRTRLPPSVTYTALALLHRLKTRFPHARGSSGHRLFLSAFMLASKVVCDDTYSNKSWAVVGQGMFALREINQMEREMCGYLEWQLNVPKEDLEAFEREVRRVFGAGASRNVQQGVTMLLNNGVGGKPYPSSVPTITPPPVPSTVSPSAPPVPEKPLSIKEPASLSTSPQQLPTPTEGGATQIPSFARRGVAMPVPQVPQQMQQQQQQTRRGPYPSPPTTPPSPAISSSTRSLGSRTSQATIQVARQVAYPPQPQPQYIIPTGMSDADSDSDSECDSDEDDEDRQVEDSERRLTDSPSPTPSASTCSSAASEGSLRTPPSAKAPAGYHPSQHPHAVHQHGHHHSGSYGLVKSFSLPPGVHHAGNNVQRSQTMPSSEFVVSVPVPQARFVGAYGSNNANAMNVDNGSEAEYVGAPAPISNGNAKKMQAMIMPRTYTVPCAW